MQNHRSIDILANSWSRPRFRQFIDRFVRSCISTLDNTPQKCDLARDFKSEHISFSFSLFFRHLFTPPICPVPTEKSWCDINAIMNLHLFNKKKMYENKIAIEFFISRMLRTVNCSRFVFFLVRSRTDSITWFILCMWYDYGVSPPQAICSCPFLFVFQLHIAHFST